MFSCLGAGRDWCGHCITGRFRIKDSWAYNQLLSSSLVHKLFIHYWFLFWQLSSAPKGRIASKTVENVAPPRYVELFFKITCHTWIFLCSWVGFLCVYMCRATFLLHFHIKLSQSILNSTSFLFSGYTLLVFLIMRTPLTYGTIKFDWFLYWTQSRIPL